MHVPLFPILQSIKNNNINNLLENDFCSQVTITIAGSTVETDNRPDPQKRFQELASGKLLILLRDRPCLE